MQTVDFTLDDRAYRAEKLGAIEQFQLSRKLAPLLPPLAPLFLKIAQPRGASGDLLSLVSLAEPFAKALAELTDETAEQLVTMTLAAVKTETSPGTWMPVWIAGAKTAAVVELNDFGKLLPVMLRVIQLNLGPFISGFLTSHEEPSATAFSGESSPVARTGS
jgi:hypothetical protein